MVKAMSEKSTFLKRIFSPQGFREGLPSAVSNLTGGKGSAFVSCFGESEYPEP